VDRVCRYLFSNYLYRMKYLFLLIFPCLLVFGATNAQVVFRKMDTTLKIGRPGYRVDCRNKNYDQNQLTIRPLGFDGEVKDMSFVIKGRVAKAEIDDLNSDGFPDLVLYIYSDSNAVFGTVYAFLSEGNKAVVPCALPDVMLNGKINAGYKGHDQFSLLETYLQQKFPIYKAGDDKDKPTGGVRVILYQLGRNEQGGFKFDIVRFYDSQ
jgi:hypothetical protein